MATYTLDRTTKQFAVTRGSVAIDLVALQATAKTLNAQLAQLVADSVPVVIPPVVPPPPPPQATPVLAQPVPNGTTVVLKWTNAAAALGCNLLKDGVKQWIGGWPNPTPTAFTDIATPGTHTYQIVDYDSTVGWGPVSNIVTVVVAGTPPVTPPPPPLTAGKIPFWRWNNGTLTQQAMVNDGIAGMRYSDYAYSAGGRNSNSYAQSGAQSATDLGQQLVLAVSDLTLAEGLQVGLSCMHGGQPDAWFRVMWELNQHGWFAQWSQVAYPTAIAQAQAFMTAVDGLDSTPGSNFSYIFNPNIDSPMSGNSLPGRTWHDVLDVLLTHTRKNGKPYVQAIGIDGYDNNGAFSNDLVDWEAFIAKAKSYGLPWGPNEWGLDITENGDDTTYINGMIALLEGTAPGEVNDPASFQGYFSFNDAAGIQSDITQASQSLGLLVAFMKAH
jgi:hypothetical protein